MNQNKKSHKVRNTFIVLLCLALAAVGVFSGLYFTNTLPIKISFLDNLFGRNTNNGDNNNGGNDNPDPSPNPLMNDFSLPRDAVEGVNAIGGDGEDFCLATHQIGKLIVTIGETSSRDKDITVTSLSQVPDKTTPAKTNIFIAISDEKNTVSRVHTIETATTDKYIQSLFFSNFVRILIESDAGVNNLIIYDYDLLTGQITHFAIPHPEHLSGKDMIIDEWNGNNFTFIFAERKHSNTNEFQLKTFCYASGSIKFENSLGEYGESYQFIKAYSNPVDGTVEIFANSLVGQSRNVKFIRLNWENTLLSNTNVFETESATNKCVSIARGSKGDFRLAIDTGKTTMLAKYDGKNFGTILQSYSERGNCRVMPIDTRDCIVFFGEVSKCIISYETGNQIPITPEGNILDARHNFSFEPNGVAKSTGIEILVRTATTLRVIDLSRSEIASTTVNLKVGYFSRIVGITPQTAALKPLICGSFWAGMGGAADGALILMDRA